MYTNLNGKLQTIEAVKKDRKEWSLGRLNQVRNTLSRLNQVRNTLDSEGLLVVQSLLVFPSEWKEFIRMNLLMMLITSIVLVCSSGIGMFLVCLLHVSFWYVRFWYSSGDRSKPCFNAFVDSDWATYPDSRYHWILHLSRKLFDRLEV